KDTDRTECGDTQTNLVCKRHDTPPRFSKGVQRAEGVAGTIERYPAPARIADGSRRDRRKRIVGLRKCDARRRHSSLHSPRTETSARPVSKSSSKEDYSIPRRPKSPSYWRGCRKKSGQTIGSDFRVASHSEELTQSTTGRLYPEQQT